MTPDHINALFELGGAMMLAVNIWRLYQDKQFRGVSLVPTAFFAAWGLWNMFYYPSLDQWFSFVAGALLVTVNLIWFGQMIYYARRSVKSE